MSVPAGLGLAGFPMALTISLPTGIAAKCIGLEVWMDRVLENAGKVAGDWGTGNVHDLRVALRRCRTMAEALREVNPDPGWRKLKKATSGLFHGLGDLRDAQVEREWVKKFGIAGDPVRKHMLRLLSGKQKKCGKDAEQALEEFDRKAWRKLSRKLESKSHFFPLESVVFQRLALSRLNEAVQLHQKARKRPSAAAWHRVRIGIKQFRYIVENFLPQRYEAWAEDLKRLQDLLGELHDLDVLRSDIRKHSPKLGEAIVAQWLEKIDGERKKRLDEFRSMTVDKESRWIVWRAGFNWGHAIKSVVASRARAAS
jgi:CHAD domain-containing protein